MIKSLRKMFLEETILDFGVFQGQRSVFGLKSIKRIFNFDNTKVLFVLFKITLFENISTF